MKAYLTTNHLNILNFPVENPLFLCFYSYNNLMGYERTCFVEPGNKK